MQKLELVPVGRADWWLSNRPCLRCFGCWDNVSPDVDASVELLWRAKDVSRGDSVFVVYRPTHDGYVAAMNTRAQVALAVSSVLAQACLSSSGNGEPEPSTAGAAGSHNAQRSTGSVPGNGTIAGYGGLGIGGATVVSAWLGGGGGAVGAAAGSVAQRPFEATGGGDAGAGIGAFAFGGASGIAGKPNLAALGGAALGGTAAKSSSVALGGTASSASVGLGGSSQSASGQIGGCAALTYPSGVILDTVRNAVFTAEYEKFEGGDCSAPHCFIDVENLKSPNGRVYDIHVKLAEHFELYELVSSDVDPKNTGDVDPEYAYSTLVLVDVTLVEQLEALRKDYGGPVNLSSGFRSPKHQQALCRAICGEDECKDSSGTTCAKSSKHMWGTAADMSIEYEASARNVSFGYVLHENGGTAEHLHVDMRKCQ